MSINTKAPSLANEIEFSFGLLSDWALLTAASAMAVKYSATLENGPWLLQPSDEAVDNLPMIGSPVFDIEEIEPI
jgi:hypothetical protein